MQIIFIIFFNSLLNNIHILKKQVTYDQNAPNFSPSLPTHGIRHLKLKVRRMWRTLKSQNKRIKI